MMNRVIYRKMFTWLQSMGLQGEQTLFDLLYKDDLSEQDEKQVKLTAKKLLSKFKREKLVLK